MGIWETLSLKPSSNTSSIAFARCQGGLEEPEAHLIAQEESPSAIKLDIHNRSVWQVSNYALLTRQKPDGPEKERIEDPELSLMMPPIPLHPGLPLALPLKLSLSTFYFSFQIAQLKAMREALHMCLPLTGTTKDFQTWYKETREEGITQHQTKPMEDSIPQKVSKLTGHHPMIHRLRFLKTHRTSIHQNKLSFTKIVHRQDASGKGQPSKSYNSGWNLKLPDVCKRRGRSKFSNKDME